MAVPKLLSATPALVAALLLVSSHRVDAVETTYAVDAGRSSVVVHVGKEGVLSFAGHEHVVTAPRLQGKIQAAPDDLSRCLVTLVFEAAALRVQEKGEPKGDAAKVQETMLGPQVLDVSRYPSVTFKSKTVAGRATARGAYQLDINPVTVGGVVKVKNELTIDYAIVATKANR